MPMSFPATAAAIPAVEVPCVVVDPLGRPTRRVLFAKFHPLQSSTRLLRLSSTPLSQISPGLRQRFGARSGSDGSIPASMIAIVAPAPLVRAHAAGTSASAPSTVGPRSPGRLSYALVPVFWSAHWRAAAGSFDPLGSRSVMIVAGGSTVMLCTPMAASSWSESVVRNENRLSPSATAVV